MPSALRICAKFGSHSGNDREESRVESCKLAIEAGIKGVIPLWTDIVGE
jgi:hypothetical protein